jgi:hypothetical protein
MPPEVADSLAKHAAAKAANQAAGKAAAEEQRASEE